MKAFSFKGPGYCRHCDIPLADDERDLGECWECEKKSFLKLKEPQK